MKRMHVTGFAALLAAGAIALTAAGPASATSVADSAASTSADILPALSIPQDLAAKKPVHLTAGSANGLTPIVRDAAGFTLYRFDKDSGSPSMSNCYGGCATAWPPALVQPGQKIYVNGVPESEVGVVQRTDGNLQITIGGWPVYRFINDTAPGQTNGEGVGGSWFAVSPRGEKVLPPATTGTA
jgi:predicted lipoprotein with Yx(FWY)xxD motif